jgi:hypothetical protein
VDSPASLAVAHAPRAVATSRAFAWFEEAMHLFKRAPFNWCVLGFITLASELCLRLVPGIGVAASQVIVPVVDCGMLIGAAAIDRGAPLEIRYAVAAFGASPAALAAIVVSALLVFAAEALASYSLAGVNLLAAAEEPALTASTLITVFAIGTAVSLPLVFVPMAALFEKAAFGRAFAISARGFALNVAPLALFGVLALLLIIIGLFSYGIALIAVFPLLAVASYAAWKDIYAVSAPTT